MIRASTPLGINCTVSAPAAAPTSVKPTPGPVSRRSTNPLRL